MLANADNQPVMPRADDPGEGDDSKETNTAVDLQPTNPEGERKIQV